MNRLIALLSSVLWASCVHAQDFQVYVSDAPNFGQPPWQILKFDSDGRNPEVFISENLSWPHDLLFLEESGSVLVSNFNSGRIERFDSETGEHIDTFAASIPAPTRMSIGPDGLLYVLSANANARVKRYTLDGSYVDDFTSIGLPGALGLAWDEHGSLYVSSYDLQIVRMFDSEGIDQGSFVYTHLSGPTNIWFDDNGDLLVLDYDAGVVSRFDRNGGYLGSFIEGLSQPEGVGFLPGSEILIGNGGTSAVKSFTADGDFMQDFVTSQSGGLTRPNAVVVRVEEVEINCGMSDAWYDPAIPGQGFFITVYPDAKQLFLSWYTYDTERPAESVTAILGEPGHRWLTAQGPFEGNTAELTVHLTQGGVFDAPDPPASTEEDAYGNMTLEFMNCREGLVSYEIPSLGLVGQVAVERVMPDNVALCEALQ